MSGANDRKEDGGEGSEGGERQGRVPHSAARLPSPTRWIFQNCDWDRVVFLLETLQWLPLFFLEENPESLVV